MLYPFGCHYSIFLERTRMLPDYGRRFTARQELKLGFVEQTNRGRIYVWNGEFLVDSDYLFVPYQRTYIISTK